MGHISGFARFVGTGVRFAAGVAASCLPRRWWDDLDLHVPASGAAVVSSAVTILAAAAIGIPGFLSYAGHTASAHNEAALRGAASGGPALDNEGALRRVPMALNMIALPMFLLLTPAGWATCYFGVSGVVRLGSALLDEGMGDPLLTGADALVRRTISGSRTKAAALSRAAREGPEMPDRVASAQQLGVAGADLVIVSSRRKHEWDTGTILLTAEGTAYRVGVIEERTIAGRLRTVYGLTLHADLEAFRRVVRYELPPGRR